MKKAWLTVPALILSTLPHAAAAEVYCSGTIESSWVDEDGDVMIQPSWHESHIQICNLETTWKGINPPTCAAWAAKMDAAASLDRGATLGYLSESVCSAIPHYQLAPAPYYVMLK